MPAITIFGEVLFDHFPDGSRVLGGAPFNVAWHLQAFGVSPRLVSRVGDDAEGVQVRAAMTNWGMATDDLQLDKTRPTGRVDVRFSAGEPDYEIVADCAYDHIEPVVSMPGTLLYHGSLAARTHISATSLRKLRADAPNTVFIDVNLRDPWWQALQIENLIAGADWIKLNSDELAVLGGAAGTGNPERDFLGRYGLEALLVTRGARGAELFMAGGEQFEVAPLPRIKVMDTVGAGDAFASVMLLGLLMDWPLPLTLERAQQFAAAIVGQRGATVSEADFYREFSQQWQITP